MEYEYESMYMFSQIITRSMATMWKLRDSWHTQASDLSLWLNEKTGSSEAARLLQVGTATHLVGGHLLWRHLQYLCIFSLAWLSSVCFGWSAQKWQFCIYCAKCLSNSTTSLCRLSPARDSFSLCSDLCHLLFTYTACWGPSTTSDCTFIFWVLQQQQTCPNYTAIHFPTNVSPSLLLWPGSA